MTECRNFGCDNAAREDAGGAYSRKFCSDECEVKHDHIKADARDAQRADQQAADTTGSF